MLPLNQLILPCCYFPTDIMLIDDHPAMFDTLKFSLSGSIRNETSAKKALTDLLAYQPRIAEAQWLDLDCENDIWDGTY